MRRYFAGKGLRQRHVWALTRHYWANCLYGLNSRIWQRSRNERSWLGTVPSVVTFSFLSRISIVFFPATSNRAHVPRAIIYLRSGKSPQERPFNMYKPAWLYDHLQYTHIQRHRLLMNIAWLKKYIPLRWTIRSTVFSSNVYFISAGKDVNIRRSGYIYFFINNIRRRSQTVASGRIQNCSTLYRVSPV